MVKRLFIFCFVFICHEMAEAQGENEEKINQLKNLLPSLKDTARINCLNSIASLYSFSDKYSYNNSVSAYGLPALEESRKLNYKKGIIASLLALGNNDGRTDNARAEKHLKELITISDDDSITAYAQLRLGQSLWNEAKYDEGIQVLTSSAAYYKKKNDIYRLIGCLGIISQIYSKKGNYVKASEYAQEALQKSRTIGNRRCSLISSMIMAELYMSVQDYETAKKYIDAAFLFLDFNNNTFQKDSLNKKWIGRNYLRHLGDLCFYLHKYDSALYYYQYAWSGYPTANLYKLHFANVYLAQENYIKALPLLELSRKEAIKAHEENAHMQSLIGLSKLFLGKRDYKTAQKFATQALDLAEAHGARLVVRDASLLLSDVNEELGNMRLALAYHKNYVLLKDSIMNDQYKGKLIAFKQSTDEEVRLSEFNLLNERLAIQQHQLKQSRLTKNILAGSILLFALLCYIFFHYILLKGKNERLRNDQAQALLKQRATDLEMQALRAQMNPHFIFNCLSSINRFILKSDTEIASDYLTRFSRLVRLVLIHSKSALVLLGDELEMLRYYLDMEQLRFKNSFDYIITFTNSVNPENIRIPPLLLQPFCENAIRHGLMHKEGRGHLEIRLSRENNMLHCEIIDNGVGLAKAAEIKSKSDEKRKSMGLELTSERLALINEEEGVKSGYSIEDLLVNGEVRGTKVNLFIRCNEQVSVMKKELSRQS